MKRGSLVFICYCLIYSGSFSQALNWQWARATTGTGQQETGAVATDKDGNVYVTGWFGGDSMAVGNINLYNGGFYNIFIAKYSPTGQVLWAKSSANSYQTNVYGSGIATDEGGNVYVTGAVFGDSATFGNITVYNIDTPAQRGSIFIARYDTSGNVVWLNKLDAHFSERLFSAVAADATGGVYLTGFFDGQSLTLDTMVLANPQTSLATEIFIARYDNSGKLSWAQNTGQTINNGLVNVNEAVGIAATIDGNAYITGSFTGPAVTFGNIYVQNNDTGSVNVFIAKYNHNGVVQWAKNAAVAYASAIAVDKAGDAYITGSFTGDSIAFGQVTLRNHAPDTGAGNSNFFVVKYDPQGNVLWGKSARAGQNNQGSGVTTNYKSDVYVSGFVPKGDSITFDNQTLVAAVDSPPMFIVSYDAEGNLLCAGIVDNGGFYNNLGSDFSGNVYAVGYYVATPFTLGNDTLQNTGNQNGFLAKFICGYPLGVEQTADNVFLQLYPNPLTTQATVQYALPDDSKNATLIIYDILGRCRNTYPLSNAQGQITINTGNLSSGIYLYSLVVDGKTLTTKKMVVQD